MKVLTFQEFLAQREKDANESSGDVARGAYASLYPPAYTGATNTRANNLPDPNTELKRKGVKLISPGSDAGVTPAAASAEPEKLPAGPSAEMIPVEKSVAGQPEADGSRPKDALDKEAPAAKKGKK